MASDLEEAYYCCCCFGFNGVDDTFSSECIISKGCGLWETTITKSHYPLVIYVQARAKSKPPPAVIVTGARTAVVVCKQETAGGLHGALKKKYAATGMDKGQMCHAVEQDENLRDDIFVVRRPHEEWCGWL